MTFRALNVRFNLCKFRSRSRLIQDVTWPVVQSCLRHELLVTVIFSVRFASQTTWSNQEIIEETLRFQMTFRWSSLMTAFSHQGLVIQKLGVNCPRSNFPWLSSSQFRFSVLRGRRPKSYPWGVREVCFNFPLSNHLDLALNGALRFSELRFHTQPTEPPVLNSSHCFCRKLETFSWCKHLFHFCSSGGHRCVN